MFWKKFKQQIEKIMENDFEGMDVFNITQILRGTYYIFIDSLLSLTGEIKKKESLETVIEVLVLHLKMTVQFFKKMPSLFNDVKLN